MPFDAGFRNREEAGRKLAEYFARQGVEDAIVLALPRGGVPVAEAVAEALRAPLEVLVVRKIGAPGNPEYGIGAIAEDGYVWLDAAAAKATGSSPAELAARIQAERTEIARRVALYREGRPLPSLRDRTVILVDDGLATGVTARAAIGATRSLGAGTLILAAPVCARKTAHHLASLADGVVCLEAPERLYAVAEWYEDFAQLTDDEVVSRLRRSHSRRVA